METNTSFETNKMRVMIEGLTYTAVRSDLTRLEIQCSSTRGLWNGYL